MKLKIFTAGTKDLEWRALAHNCFLSAQEYSNKYPQKLISVHEFFFEKDIFKRPPAWYKIKLLLEQKFDDSLLLWLDADSHINNFNFDIFNLTDTYKNKDIFVSTDQNGINLGVLLVRLTKNCKDIFQKTWDNTEFIGSMWEDQSSFNDLFYKNYANVISKTKILRSAEFNCYKFKKKYNKECSYFSNEISPFVIHTPGYSLNEKLFNNIIYDMVDGDRDSFVDYIKRNSLNTGAEVGVNMGDFSDKLLSSGGTLYMIDPYCYMDEYIDIANSTNYIREMDYNFVINRFSNEISQGRAKVMKMKSLQAAELIENESLDYVYIDGNHRLEYVVDDLNVWWSKVKRGGILAGHDYQNSNDGSTIIDVKTAVDKFIDDNWPVRCFASSEASNKSFFIIKP